MKGGKKPGFLKKKIKRQKSAKANRPAKKKAVHGARGKFRKAR